MYNNKYNQVIRNALSTTLKDLKNELFHLRMLQVAGQLGNPARINIVRGRIAKVKVMLASTSAA